MNKSLTYASIVPLIGGESIGISKALGNQDPEYILSYSPFEANDDHYVSYLRTQKGWDGDYVLLDEKPDYKPKSVDVVNTVCPCAGLSSLSPVSGAESEKNDWMFHTARYVLENIKPQVFWGENAPLLFSESGRPVAQKLHKIAQDFGYTLTLYFTKSFLHGVPQTRPRTFYFFTKEDNLTPIFSFFQKEPGQIEDILQQDLSENDLMNVLINKKDPHESPWIRYCMHKHNAATIMDLYNMIDSTINAIPYAVRLSNRNVLEVAEFIENAGLDLRAADRARKIQKKIDQGKNFRPNQFIVPKGIIPSLIKETLLNMVNPFKDQHLTIRDSFRIMGLPDDMDLTRPGHINAICQNVPVTTAQDMMYNVISYLNGECDMQRGSFSRQNNASQTIVEVMDEERGSLSEFLNLHTPLN